MYTLSSRIAGSMSQGSVALLPKTASTEDTTTAENRTSLSANLKQMRRTEKIKSERSVPVF